ncbi:recombinase A [Haloterrigena salina JCM 13891]|uniref:Recombinase A n=1 Tax=Haloterrigena salina JCM 13891 TaxID=1227488 RepID=M0CN83_9EURY|nr:hypothetical protein [Haloterrigena salina]ELZ23862.1 recombinase A [Haloterrigena salina JCM 13891]
MSLPEREYTTGIDVLDRFIGGGLKAGVLAALRAPASSQSERLLAELVAQHRTVFVSITRSEREVRDWIERTVDMHHELTVRTPTVDDVLADPDDAIGPIPPESILVVDPMDLLESEPRDRYLAVLDAIKEQLRTADSVGLVHCLEADRSPANRELTLKRADQVWRLETTVRSQEIRTRLLITKARRGRTFDKPIPLVLSDRVRIDHSRNI